ncbi:unnamed protein product [Ilex paraguariensis]|uniref:glutathione transferase n=1 Tax=Ilex paraguariensis TaxID=185542 RepID=A0ABC8RKW1_9AQUA
MKCSRGEWKQEADTKPAQEHLDGIEHDTIFEDLDNKSPLLLQYKPVYKQVPVLVQNGNPISGSLIILEYIEETWKQTPLLLEDPYEKATARFWAKLNDEKLLPSTGQAFIKQGKEQKESIVPAMEIPKCVEELLKGKTFFGGENIGILDLAFGWIATIVSLFEEITGLKMIDSEKFPLLSAAWMENFSDVPVIKENWPPQDKLITKFQAMHETYLAAAAPKGATS